MRNTVHKFQLHHSIRQQAQTPLGISFGRLTTGEGSHMRFHRTINFLFGILPHIRTPGQRRIKSLLHQLFANLLDMGCRHLQRLTDLLVLPCRTTLGFVGLQQYPRSGNNPRRLFPVEIIFLSVSRSCSDNRTMYFFKTVCSLYFVLPYAD